MTQLHQMFAYKPPATARTTDKAVENRAAKANKSEALHPAQLTIVSKQSSKPSQSSLLSSMKQASKPSQSTLRSSMKQSSTKQSSMNQSSMKQSSKQSPEQSQSSLLSSKPSQSSLAPHFLKAASGSRSDRSGSSRIFKA